MNILNTYFCINVDKAKMMEIMLIWKQNSSLNHLFISQINVVPLAMTLIVQRRWYVGLFEFDIQEQKTSKKKNLNITASTRLKPQEMFLGVG